jgi:hypothetical protein
MYLNINIILFQFYYLLNFLLLDEFLGIHNLPLFISAHHTQLFHVLDSRPHFNVNVP